MKWIKIEIQVFLLWSLQIIGMDRIILLAATLYRFVWFWFLLNVEICHQEWNLAVSNIYWLGVGSILRPRQNSRHYADDTFKGFFLNENVRISIKIAPRFITKCLINNILALVQIMTWRRPGDKPLSEPMMVRLPTHICITRPKWVKTNLTK